MWPQHKTCHHPNLPCWKCSMFTEEARLYFRFIKKVEWKINWNKCLSYSLMSLLWQCDQQKFKLIPLQKYFLLTAYFKNRKLPCFFLFNGLIVTTILIFAQPKIADKTQKFLWQQMSQMNTFFQRHISHHLNIIWIKRECTLIDPIFIDRCKPNSYLLRCFSACKATNAGPTHGNMKKQPQFSPFFQVILFFWNTYS